MLADEQIIFESPDPKGVYCYSPALLQTATGRLIATCDLGGPGVKHLPGAKSMRQGDPNGSQGRVFVSNDDGQTWQDVDDFPLRHARPFQAGNRIYILGHAGSMGIMFSEDDGLTWSKVHTLDDQHTWHQAPCAYDIQDNQIYLTMEQQVQGQTWPGVAPVVMRANLDADLTQRENWTFSNPLIYHESVQTDQSIGIPFYPTGNVSDERFNGDPCWLESHVVRIRDPRHNLYDPTGNKVHLWMRMHTGMANIAAIAQCRTLDDGSLKLELVSTRVGSKMVFVPLPGGQMKFHLHHDPISQTWWLLSSQTTDSMVKPELLAQDRYNLPDNERHRLQLHYSTNLFDWQYAGLVAAGQTQRHSRHYAHMIGVGDDLIILARSGDHRAASAHNGNLLTLHRVKDFRTLIDPAIVPCSEALA